ncbi:MAG: hypothetical protein M3421_02770, partial [Bacteroidota bacterium]|nr:hypothetical protein [Bacteroidota bacterium]
MKVLFLKYNLIKNFFSGVFQGHERSVKLKKNILLSFLFKIFSAISSFFLVPITLNYLEPVKYGIWLTLSSLIAW